MLTRFSQWTIEAIEEEDLESECLGQSLVPSTTGVGLHNSSVSDEVSDFSAIPRGSNSDRNGQLSPRPRRSELVRQGYF